MTDSHVTFVIAVSVLVGSWTPYSQGPVSRQSPDEQIENLTQKVNELEQRIEALEEQRPSRVTAPFEVVDERGRVVVRITADKTGEISLLDADGQQSVSISERSVAVVANRQRVAQLAAVDGRGSIAITFDAGDGGGQKIAAELTTDPESSKQGVLRVYGGSQNGVGAVVNGRGEVLVFDPDAPSDSDLAGITVESDGGGKIFVKNDHGESIVELSEAEGQGQGSLTVANQQGDAIFKVSEKIEPVENAVTISKVETKLAINVYGSSKEPLVSMGEAKVGGGVFAAYNMAKKIGAILSGTGQIHVADDSGRTFATMVAEKGQGAFTIRSQSGTTVARLGEGTGGGLFQLANHAGNALVEAGIHPADVGLVRTFPLGRTGATMVGLPGTFLIGRPGGK